MTQIRLSLTQGDCLAAIDLKQILAYSNTQTVEEVLWLQARWQNFPIQPVALWVFLDSERVYRNDQGTCSKTSSRNISLDVSRQLNGGSPVQTSNNVERPDHSADCGRNGVSDQQAKINGNTHPETYLARSQLVLWHSKNAIVGRQHKTNQNQSVQTKTRHDNHGENMSLAPDMDGEQSVIHYKSRHVTSISRENLEEVNLLRTNYPHHESSHQTPPPPDGGYLKNKGPHAKGHWSWPQQKWHINCTELVVAWLFI